jgi:hypothetical protein
MVTHRDRTAGPGCWGEHEVAPYEEWSEDELYEQARDLRIEGRQRTSRAQLIGALSTRPGPARRR